jgi:hypothetical protein
MNTPKIGQCKYLVDILEVTTPYSVDGSGTIKSTFKSNVRAKIEPVGGQMEEMTQQLQIASQDYRVWIWNYSGVTAFQQLRWGGKRLVITAPPEKITDYWMLINCRETFSRKL